ncbi:hypothetical protein KEF85_07045 [Methylomonas paludis]|uniref:Uncharacterized protein n=1 Tax=Methylomonas paludis TaxID=1173101 RepID=A0A975RBB7_9GAMM|nr:hypothetical protein [Methylomonas paludis]QWF72199.1 hypothetical protein KEF85_07045 [Methylomonas paludis]
MITPSLRPDSISFTAANIGGLLQIDIALDVPNLQAHGSQLMRIHCVQRPTVPVKLKLIDC